MGSFSCGGQRFSLMTMDAVKASHFDDQLNENTRPWPLTANVSMVTIGDTMHVVQPIRHEETSMLDDTSKFLPLKMLSVSLSVRPSVCL